MGAGESDWRIEIMNPSSLIRKELGDDLWSTCHANTSSNGDLLAEQSLSPFRDSKTYIIPGRTSQFDFRTLPSGSYCVFVADGRKAVRLTRSGKEIEFVLKEKWDALALCNPIVLASLILMFYDEGIKATHRVLSDAKDLRSFERNVGFGREWVLNAGEMQRIEDLIGDTTVRQLDDAVFIRAATLCGWMHDKQNLGIENIRILPSGEVQLGKREVLSERIFDSVPNVTY